MTELDFSCCGKFSGENGQFVNRWLPMLEWALRQYKVDGEVPPELLLPAINVLLTGQAEEWIKRNPAIAGLLENPTVDSKKTFLEAFRKQFPQRFTGSCPGGLRLSQRKQETLADYYQTGLKVMGTMHVVDHVVKDGVLWWRQNSLVLDAFVNNWIHGIAKAGTRSRLIEVKSELTTLKKAYQRAVDIEEAEKGIDVHS
ncbi:hypothetical protein PAAG_00167 [Paracoccidioides lutzii Pb01]|uniref:Retrotransposon gag domain-containing protein n=1 Tax=Paracoccidioides lutzii (strain ATCC MYA-826 / Pb01) TaxID=502779 RepID=C1GNS2_PARBA|nr:hypothetical protein PAAG_00167 [Paracoccidioides lutzii Pb01]EEH35844.2 hypothetical protein PAAG_00167 [Paracoccidioides lutzii Pb01]